MFENPFKRKGLPPNDHFSYVKKKIWIYQSCDSLVNAWTSAIFLYVLCTTLWRPRSQERSYTAKKKASQCCGNLWHVQTLI